MCGFAGFVDYGANFLKDISGVTKYLWKMAGDIGPGADYGIDVVEECGAFAQNSMLPLSGSDYCFKHEGGTVYFFRKGFMPSLCGAVFVPAKKSLYLFREAGGSPVYYMENGGLFVFGTSAEAVDMFGETKNPGGSLETLNPGHSFLYN